MNREHLTTWLAGALFGVGLIVAGMTQPSKVVGFLDFAGDWDPSLAFVMVGGILVYTVGLPLLTKSRPAPVFSPRFMIPTRRDITPRLIAGSALFGIGWGLGGFCPGPGLTSITAGLEPVLFVGSMAVGMLAYRAWDTAMAARRTPEPEAAPSS